MRDSYSAASRAASHAILARRTWVLVAFDAVLITGSFAITLLFRFQGQISVSVWDRYLLFAPLAVVTFLAVQASRGLYSRIWRFASVLEARQLLSAGMVSGVLLIGEVLLIDLFQDRLVPLSVVVAGTAVATGLLGCTRFQSRLFTARRPVTQGAGLRVVIVGAGDTGAALVRQMWHSPRSGLLPVAMLDDDGQKQGRSVMGVRVAGPVDTLEQVVRAQNAHQVVLAVPSAPRALVTRVAAQADRAGVALRVVPDYEDIMRSGLRLQDVRDLRIEDLLGRAEVHTDLAAVRELLHARRVLVTGAGGSIGSEIARQVMACQPASLVLLDHDETHLHDVAAVLGEGPLLELADIRDDERVIRVLERHRPDVVFHAAAHKHVPILEAYPDEAVLTNVRGTDNLLRAARMFGVRHFVLISTDKAVEPASIMGASKRVAEFLTVTEAVESGMPFCAVRFGNVLGSRGSVIPTFMRQIQSGGPVTITDPRMTRYFMSIPEAVRLVLHASTMARGGEVFMLEMGEPVRILDLAKKMIRLTGRQVGKDVEIRVTGMRPGEKLEEQLRCDDELPQETTHPAVVRLNPRVPDRETLRAAVIALVRLSQRVERSLVRDELLTFAGQQAAESIPVMPDQRTIDLTAGGTTWTPSTT